MNDESIQINPKVQLSTSDRVIYIQTDETSKSDWNEKAISYLMQFYDEKMDLLESGIIKTQKVLWQMVAKDMTDNHLNYAPTQCENKWKSMKRRMRERLNRKLLGKCDKRPYPYESAMKQILIKRNDFSLVDSLEMESDHESSKTGHFFDMNLNEPPGPSNASTHSDTEDEKPAIKSNGNVAKTSLRDEIVSLKREIARQNNLNKLTQDRAIAVQSDVAEYLKSIQEHSKITQDMEMKKLRQQDEILEQLREQNGLLQKLIERL